MKLLDRIEIKHGSDIRRVEIYQGDLANLPSTEAVDILVVSAFPGDYLPVSGTLIGALDKAGISVSSLSRNKSVDLRNQFGCWLSQEIIGRPFKRILCFEPPRQRRRPPEVVGNIFESLAPFLLGEHGQAVVATSLVASGIQAWPAEDMPPLLEAATQWLSKGLSMSCLKIVEYSPTKADTLKRLFANFKRGFQTPRESDGVTFRYDAFVSYAHKDSADVDIVVQDLLVRRKDLRLFVDRVSLREGSAWPQELYEALDSCRKVIVVLSPPYLASKHCKFEFNVALLRQNDSAMDVILPIYLQTTGLPTYMRLLQHFDCRERDAVKLKLACGEILASIYNQH